jgi:hypothetical protein
MFFRLGPDHEHIGDRRVGDPHLVAGELVAVRRLRRASAHSAGVGASVGLGQAEAADEVARGEAREIFAPLLFRAVGVDRVHDERALDRHGRAVAAVDPLDRAGDEAVADIAEPRAAIFGRDGRAQQAKRAHFAHDLTVEILVEIGFGDARLELFLGVGFGGVADHPLFVGQLMVEVERIGPIERQDGRLAHLLLRGNEVAWAPFSRAD